MAIYSPPNGLLVKIDLAGVYSPPAGLLAKLDLHPPGIVIPKRRSLQKSAGAQWQTGSQQQVAAAGQWQTMLARSKTAGMQWQAAAFRSGLIGLPWRKFNALYSFAGAGWQFALARQLSGVLPWQSMQALFSAARLDFAPNELRVAVKKASWQQAVAALLPFSAPWKSAQAMHIAALLPWDLGLLRWRDVDLRWDAARAVPHRHLPDVVIPPQPPHRCYIPPFGLAANINLAGDYMPPLGLQAGMGLACKTVIQQWIRTISGRPLMHKVSASVAGAPLRLLSVNLDHDIDSFYWSGSCVIAATDAPRLRAGADGLPVEIMVAIDGARWLMLADSFELQQVFGEKRCNVKLVGVHALLGDRYAASASHLVADWTSSAALAALGLADTGFSFEWNLPVWSLPPNTVAIERRTPAGWLADVAKAAGGIVLPVSDQKAFTVVPRYPQSWWEWSAMPLAAILDESATVTIAERLDSRAPANAVLVTGKTGGVSVKVTRAGTAGNVWAATVIDAFITESAVGRERGRRILNEAGPAWRVSAECAFAPVLKNMGSLIQVGKAGQRCMLTKISLSADEVGIVSCNIELERRQ
ncbi:MAG: hypothetical protein NT086_08895 [Proteobacteria bacterium]|nr:hypothetical protein [Pseudomonadota bacterium]